METAFQNTSVQFYKESALNCFGWLTKHRPTSDGVAQQEKITCCKLSIQP
jgi:hypothetical protein